MVGEDAAPAVNGGYDRMVGTGCLYCRVRFGVPHFSHTDDIRIKAERRHDQILL